jgi:hypothetical protein
MQTDECHITLNLSDMPTKEIDAAIKALEIQVRHYENLLDQSIRNDEILSQVKVIYHDLKKVSEKLNELKKLKEVDNSKN